MHETLQSISEIKKKKRKKNPYWFSAQNSQNFDFLLEKRQVSPDPLPGERSCIFSA